MLISDYLTLLKRSVLLLVILALLGAGAGLAASLVQKPRYQSTSIVFVSAQQAANLADLSQGADFTEQLVRSYAAIVPTPAVLQPAIDSLGLNEKWTDLAENVQATTPLDTVVLEVTVTDTSPARSADLANAITTSLTRVVANVTPPTADTATAVKLFPLQQATAPVSPVSPRIPVNVAIGLVVGVALAVFIALVRSAVTRQHQERQLQLERRPGTNSSAAG